MGMEILMRCMEFSEVWNDYHIVFLDLVAQFLFKHARGPIRV